jgi:hypothetical protein
MSRARVSKSAPADIFDADVEAFVGGKDFHALTHVFARMIDDPVSAILAHYSPLGRASNDCNDSRAEQMRELNGSQANPAGGSRHKDRFTSLQPCSLNQGIPSRKV